MSWWGKGPDKPQASTDSRETKQSPNSKPAPPVQASHLTDDPRRDASKFDPDHLPDRKQLPKGMKQIMDRSDKDDNFFDELVDGYVPDSTESNVRYAAYANRIRTIMQSAHRYVAYTSDIGESFRPVAHPWLVRSAYGVSWAYILGDVSYEGYKAYWQNQRKLNPQLQLTEKQQKATGLTNFTSPASSAQTTLPETVKPLEDWRTVMVQRGIFQSLASMGLPAFTIHSVVRYSGRAMKDVKNVRLRTWGPIGLGLTVVPFLPTLFDAPVENAVEWAFHKGFQSYGGQQYVGDLPKTGREENLAKKPKDKEL
ncbi:mitochondrial 18 KDa protein-domain-containing protein [Pseudomassariella vexata]|uniref:Mitochondrial fission process protein 1 n=1 Tax=Pseudomassariella vexata TaxID=1141098 RepID=A0A1Y2DFU7_9PEZI|nr:mitochondrial 18 KDa protein-domain-containing protein [Pseudomassariella vexata]ORY58160.1 mitochondrial 18 KDa protein-domain-containing protein [Pseudomassariella vexata]